MAISSSRPLRVAIVAGESSGDLLAAGLIKQLKSYVPNLTVAGVAGPEMIAQDCQALFAMEEIAVMGLVEVLKHLPKLWRIRKTLLQQWLAEPPDIFIGIDAPDFNLPIEKRLRQHGVLTVHYNSPTIWAWRPQRIRLIAAATDLMLTLFPFEVALYQQHSLAARFIGHPLADRLASPPNLLQARQTLGLSAQKTVIAILPGSRQQEIHYLGKLFVATARWCWQQNADVEFIMPAVNPARYQQLQQLLQQIASDLPIKLTLGQSQTAMAAADVVLLASGTASLEAMLLNKPMVVAYRVSPISFQLAKYLIKVPHIALPNILAKKALVPEFIQGQATPERLGAALLALLGDTQRMAEMQQQFQQIGQELRQQADQQAAKAIMELWHERRNKE